MPVKRLLQGAPEAAAVNRATVADPTVLDWYVDFSTRFRQRAAGLTP